MSQAPAVGAAAATSDPKPKPQLPGPNGQPSIKMKQLFGSLIDGLKNEYGKEAATAKAEAATAKADAVAAKIEAAKAKAEAAKAKDEAAKAKAAFASAKRALDEAKPKLDALGNASAEDVKRMKTFEESFNAVLVRKQGEAAASKQAYRTTLLKAGLFPGKLALATWSESMSSIVKVSTFCGVRPDCVHIRLVLQDVLLGCHSAGCMLDPSMARAQLTLLDSSNVSGALSTVLCASNTKELYQHDKRSGAAGKLSYDKYDAKLGADTRAAVVAQRDLHAPPPPEADDDCVITKTQTPEERNAELRKSAVDLVDDSD